MSYFQSLCNIIILCNVNPKIGYGSTSTLATSTSLVENKNDSWRLVKKLPTIYLTNYENILCDLTNLASLSYYSIQLNKKPRYF